MSDLRRKPGCFDKKISDIAQQMGDKCKAGFRIRKFLGLIVFGFLGHSSYESGSGLFQQQT